MSELIQLSETETEMVGGGWGPFVGPIVIQNNINVNPQVAIAVAANSPGAHVAAGNGSSAVQVNIAGV